MRKPTGHYKEKYVMRSEISKTDVNDGTAARTRPFSYDEIMVRRRSKRRSDSVEDRGGGVVDRVESDRRRGREVVDDGERRGVKGVSVSRTRDRVVESEYRESRDSVRRSKIDEDRIIDGRKERGVHERRNDQHRLNDDFGHEREERGVYERRKNQDRITDDFDNNREQRVIHERRKNQDRIMDDFDNNREERVIHERRKNQDRIKDDFDNNREVRGVHERKKNQDRPINDFGHEHEERGVHERRKNQDRSTDEHEDRVVHERRKNQDRITDDFDDNREERGTHERRKNKDRPIDNFDHEREERGTHERRKNKDRPIDNFDHEREERGVHERRKNPDRSTDDFDHERGKRHGKEYEVKDRDRGKSEHASKRTENVFDDIGKKHESRKWNDPNDSEKKQKRSTNESRHEDEKTRSKRSRSREHERDKGKRSKSPSPRGQKQRYHDAREHEELDSHTLKDVKKVSNNGSDGKIKRHDTSASRLGGYSPRKRRSETAVKTPTLNSRSPEKKNVGWDSPPVKMENSLPSSNKTELVNKHEVTINPKPAFGVLSNIPAAMNVSVDSVQLTQATRPKRRIYIENLPSSASEAAVMQWLSGYLRPFGFNHVQGTQPCISCIVNKEKGQALVEFLTPEDASAALNFDGKSFSGNIVKIRRPKDYIEASTGVSEKPVAGAVSVKNVVEDSPNKMFIGGISKVITSEMLMEIASAFGPVKAYYFEDSEHLHSPCAFVEYADQSVTVKACVGLNGMKLGGQVLTVTQATPDASSMVNHGERPFYGIPVHARPLLEKPTQVLKLNNLLDPHSLPSLSESELEETLEDIRLECARFGMVKSINVIKQTNMPTISERAQLTNDVNLMADEVTNEVNTMVDEATNEVIPMADEATNEVNPMADESTNEVNYMADETSKEANSVADEVIELSFSDKSQQHEKPADETNSHYEVQKLNGVEGVIGDKHENQTGKNETCDITMVDGVVENQKSENNLKPTDDIEMETKSLTLESQDTMKAISNLIDTFEVGCVLVEYKRTEASSMAAHCLHGRVFDGRSVSVEYVAYDDYCVRFHK